jgi:hypothetical protein
MKSKNLLWKHLLHIIKYLFSTKSYVCFGYLWIFIFDTEQSQIYRKREGNPRISDPIKDSGRDEPYDLRPGRMDVSEPSQGHGVASWPNVPLHNSKRAGYYAAEILQKFFSLLLNSFKIIILFPLP